MRKRVKYLLIALLLIPQISCNDWMEQMPHNGLIREEFWQSKEDVESVLMAAYESLANMDYKFFVLGEIRADMVIGDINQSGAEELISESNIYPANGMSDWRDFYSIINYCNEIIKNAPLVKEIDQTFTSFQLDGLMSEAYFIRSLCYFYLVRLYKEVPLVLEPSESDDVDFYLEKSTETDVLNQIVNDLESNRASAPSGGFPTIEQNKGRASKAAYNALLADIALWRFDYESVIYYVEEIERTEEFYLLPASQWFELYYPGNSLESIFELQFDPDQGQNNSTYDLTEPYSYRYDPSPKALELFSIDFAREFIRGENASIKKMGEDDYVIWKYIGRAPDGRTFRTGADLQSCNWIVYRYADVLLMKAEALSQKESPDYFQAQNILNAVRERADIPPLNLAESNTAFEDAILEERVLELAFEGKRWFDLLRMGRRRNYERKNALIEIIVSNVPSTQKRILATKLTNPLGWYLPINDNEIERNKNLVQNPYYDF